MKRIKKWLLLGLALLGWMGGRAQVAPARRAQVVDVTVESFSVPQIRLPNAAVARRINQQLRRLLITAHAEPGKVDSTASLLRQLRQQQLDCCREAKFDGSSFTGVKYEVLLNQHSLLSLSATTQFTGAHHTYDIIYLTFDLQTGRLLTLPEVLAEPLPRMQRRLQGAINRRYQEQALEVKAIYATPDDTARQHEYLRQLSWNEARQHVDLGWPAAGACDTSLLKTFALTPQALLLVYAQNWSQDEEPDNRYRFPYHTLQVKPLLTWTQAARPVPKKAAAPATRQNP